MTITIDVPDDIVAQMKVRGIPSNEVNRFAVAGIIAGINDVIPKALPWDEFFAAMIEGVQPDAKPLPDLAVSREGIYEDHD